MTMKRTGDAWMPADEYGRGLPKFSVNLLVRDLAKSLPFYEGVLGATIRYGDSDFAAMSLNGVEFMLHADHTYDHHPLFCATATRREARRRSGIASDGHRSGRVAKTRGGRRSDYSAAGGGFSAWMARRDCGRSGRIYVGGGCAAEKVNGDNSIAIRSSPNCVNLLFQSTAPTKSNTLESRMNRDTIRYPAI